MSLDMVNGNYRYMHLTGTWEREKHIEICDVHNGIQAIESRRGTSSHAENPFIALLGEKTARQAHAYANGVDDSPVVLFREPQVVLGALYVRVPHERCEDRERHVGVHAGLDGPLERVHRV